MSSPSWSTVRRRPPRPRRPPGASSPKAGDTANMPATALTPADLTDGAIGVMELMLRCGLVPSKGEARRLIQQGGVEVAGEKVKEISAAVTADQLAGGWDRPEKKVKRCSTGLTWKANP